ncbi:MAG: PleD family two-component system response regulator [Pyrinomonadaceae bacterium]
MNANEAKPKLLLADDSVTIRRVVEMTFAEENIEVFTASDGESAMLKFVETQPDIVLAHVGLPGTNGYQICEMIKQDETTRHIPVVLLVGSFEPFDESEALRVRADDRLTKPFASVRDLSAKVRDLLGHAPRPAEGAVGDDIDDLYTSSFSPSGGMEEFEAVDVAFSSSPFDDEMIETYSPAVPHAERGAAQGAEITPVEQSREFDWSPAAVVSQTESLVDQTARPEEQSVAIEHSGQFGDKAPSSVAEVAAVPVAEPATEPGTSEPEVVEPSQEFIALVAQRVVERLSDKAIREIAQEAVPRIAEKMMREALGQDKKE